MGRSKPSPNPRPLILIEVRSIDAQSNKLTHLVCIDYFPFEILFISSGTHIVHHRPVLLIVTRQRGLTILENWSADVRHMQ